MMNWMTKIVSEFTLDDCKTKEEVMEVRIEKNETAFRTAGGLNFLLRKEIIGSVSFLRKAIYD